VLSEKQRSILALCASGCTLRESAAQLGFSASHAANELQRVKLITGCPTLASCVAYALCTGEVASDPTGRYYSPFPGEAVMVE
jgi:DNA-binding CsgD family transcriptional regulator